MQSAQFKEFYNRLNPAQKKAVNTIEGPVMVVAGPGTGKTQVLTLRIANILLKTDVQPDNILALTFTESAAANMRARLVKIIGTPGFRVEISTFHSFCNDIIKSFPENFPHLISSSSITELEQIQIIEELVLKEKLELLKPFGDPLYYVRSIKSAIDELKKEGVTVEQFKEGLVKQREEFDKIPDLIHEKGAYKGEMKGKYQELLREIDKNQELAGLYMGYQQALFDNKQYDFNDMLLQVKVQLEKDRNLLLSLQEKYQYVLVDEHQDTNAAQNKIIELLCSFYDNPNLFVVGDEKQAIFRFQGASLENFIYFKSIYPKAELVQLTDNYRSNQTILDAAGSLISQNSMANVLFPEAAALKAQGGLPEEMIKVVELNDYHAEYHYVAQAIAEKIEQGIDAGEIAVIGRNNKDLTPLTEVLESKGIGFTLESDQNLFADPQVKKLIMLLRAINNFGDNAGLMTALHIDCLDCQPLDIYKVMRYSQKNRTEVIEIISNPKLLKQLGLDCADNFSDFYDKLKNWEAMSHNQNFETLFTSVLNDSGLMKWVLKQPNSLEVLDKFTSIFEDIKLQVSRRPDYSLSDFLTYLDLLQKHDLVVKRGAKTILKSAVHLMTAHKSKGLEFGYVFILNCFDGHWGNAKKRSGGFKLPWEYLGVKLKLGVELDQNEDERRLFYVSLTRAKQEVWISYSMRGLDGREQVPSQFISEIHEGFKKIVEIAEFENDFMSHKEIIFAPKISMAPQAKNKEFLNNIFLDRGLSVTALGNYLDCPWKYFYRNLLMIPDVKNKSLIFGTAVHNALNVYLKMLKVGTPDQAYVIQAFREALKKENPSEEDFADLLKKGEKILPGYYEQSMKNWHSQLLSELYVKGVKLDEGIFLNGKIDMIEPVVGVNQVIVTDFKTGKPKTRNQISGDGSGFDYLRQLVFYKMLLDGYQYRKMSVKKGVIEFVEPDTKGKYHKEEFEIEPEQVQELSEIVKQVGKEILELAFWERRCGEKDCNYCALADMTVRESATKPLTRIDQVMEPTLPLVIPEDPEMASLLATAPVEAERLVN